VARAEAAKNRPMTETSAEPAQRRGPTLEPRRDSGRSGAVAARSLQPLANDMAAMSAVREVEVDMQPADPQGAIDRAIATLDREARGDMLPPLTEDAYDEEPIAPRQPRRNGSMNGSANGALNGALNDGFRRDDAPLSRGGRDRDRDRDSRPKPAREFASQARRVPRARSERERGGFGAVSVFLIVFVVLLVGAGGAGFWAWQEGFINLDAMFGKNQPAVTTTATAQAAVPDGPGNTEAAPADTQPSTELQGGTNNARMVGETPSPETGAALALQTPGADAKTEERLGAGTEQNADSAVAAIDSNTTGSQSLLLEASDSGSSGALPFSGTVDWSKGVDETGQPTLIGKASIPARNLQVDVLIRKNSDPSLPASHLMEINFTVSDSFLGGSIAGLPGVLLKNEELVQGQPLVGASARVVGNSFLFALSAAPEDSTANVGLLTSRKWIDLALIYATGKRAIITLEKDATAQALFNEVFTAWGSRATT
ncbi:MAG: hypothetical protein ABL879_15670, partial [Devosia sp.]